MAKHEGQQVNCKAVLPLDMGKECCSARDIQSSFAKLMDIVIPGLSAGSPMSCQARPGVVCCYGNCSLHCLLSVLTLQGVCLTLPLPTRSGCRE